MIDPLVDLAQAELHRLEDPEYPFYATGDDLPIRLSELFTGLSESGIMLLDGSDGFVAGRLVNAPPVYAPGGPVCLSQFLVGGEALVSGFEEQVVARGGVLACFEVRANDFSKQAMLSKLGYSPASDWHYRDVLLEEPAGGFEAGTSDDVSDIVGLCETARLRLQEYQPVFWRKAADSAEKQAGFLRYLIDQKSITTLVHRGSSGIDGVVTAATRGGDFLYELRPSACYTDDFALADESYWETLGAELLKAIVSLERAKGALYSQVICPHLNLEKGRMLQTLGYRLGHQWFTKVLSAAA